MVFKGKSRGLSDLASRQRKDGQWVAALYLGRDILLYSPATTVVSLTKIEGRGESVDLQPLTILHSRHYQSLKPAN